jgi:hypothetical protein
MFRVFEVVKEIRAGLKIGSRSVSKPHIDHKDFPENKKF